MSPIMLPWKCLAIFLVVCLLAREPPPPREKVRLRFVLAQMQIRNSKEIADRKKNRGETGRSSVMT